MKGGAEVGELGNVSEGAMDGWRGGSPWAFQSSG
jgi:hypothetical protein